MQVCRIAMVVCVALVAASCGRRNIAPPSDAAASLRRQQIERLQEFSREKGFPETGNFQRADARQRAYYLCYFTGPFELPEDYRGLGYKERDERGCRIDESRHDVYFHRAEAVAMEDAPITQSLEQASNERALMVAAHEEAHEAPPIDRFPEAAAESATTLLGILTAAAFAMKEGDTATATHLSEDARIFARKAEAVNELHAALRALYREHRAGRRNRAQTASAKQKLLAAHAHACAHFGRAHSINPCLPASNNAGVAFEHTYTRFYPQFYALYEAAGSDLDRFLAALRQLGQDRAPDVTPFETRLREAIAGAEERNGPHGGKSL